MSRRFSLSTAARVTVVAGLLSAALAAGFAYWIRHEVYTSRYQLSDEEAYASLLDLSETARRTRNLDFPLMPGRRTVPTFEVRSSDGRVLGWQNDPLGPLARRPMLPAPLPGDEHTGDFQTRLVLPTYQKSLGDCDYRAPRCEITRLSGREVKVRRAVFALRHASPGKAIPPDRNVAISVLILPLEAEDAVASLDKVLRPALPAAVLLIMLGAYFGTRLALRPVERIRVQAAEIGERSLHQRVPVPPTHDVVARLAVTLNETLDRLDKAADRQRGFIADAAHELRSPIASLRATLEVATEHSDRADWATVGEAAVEDTRRLQALADDLLLVARLDAGGRAERVEVDLAELVRRHVGRRLSDDGPRLEVEAVESAAVLGDPRQLDRLLRNLVDNAVRHARAVVSVHVEDQAGRVVVHVDDDGSGIPVAARRRVFERFIRLDEARSRDAGGVGLGLAIAREIAVRHGGTLTIDDSPTGGARLTLDLPTAG